MKTIEQSELIVVTDGSVEEIDMSFGWKICTLKGDIIAEHRGLAFGQASSFQAKGYGVLSAFSFFCHAMEYTASTKNLTCQMYLDNKGVIARIQQQQSYTTDYSFNTLTLDWDVITQISNILDIGTFIPKIQHIQGHQDKYKKYDNLSLPAKLNVDDNLLAVEYQALNKKTTREVMRLPANV
eukprot:12869841-Ditylum_brightwellii.AAC.1